MKYFISQIVFLEQDTIDSLFSNGIQFDDANESLFDCFTATLTEGADAVVANKIAGSPNGNRFSIKLSLTHLRYEAFYILNCFFFQNKIQLIASFHLESNLMIQMTMKQKVCKLIRVT